MGHGGKDTSTSRIDRRETLLDTNVRELLETIEGAEDQATKLDQKFLAYLLSMARIEAQKLVKAAEARKPKNVGC